MRVKADHATIKEILGHANAIAKAFTEFQSLISTAIAPAPEDVRREVGAILFDMNVVPVDAIFSLREVARFYQDEEKRLQKAADAVRRHRQKKGEGLARQYNRGATPQKSRPPELFDPADYEAIAAELQAAERTTPAAQPLIDATPTVGKATLDF